VGGDACRDPSEAGRVGSEWPAEASRGVSERARVVGQRLGSRSVVFVGRGRGSGGNVRLAAAAHASAGTPAGTGCRVGRVAPVCARSRAPVARGGAYGFAVRASDALASNLAKSDRFACQNGVITAADPRTG